LAETYDYVLLLQPTSPLRRVEDIDNSLEFFQKNDALSCISVTESDDNPYLMHTIDRKRRLHSLLDKPLDISRRQDLPPSYVINGALYIADTNWLKTSRVFLSEGTIGYIMPKNRSVDIDEAFDFDLCEFLLRKN